MKDILSDKEAHSIRAADSDQGRAAKFNPDPESGELTSVEHS